MRKYRITRSTAQWVRIAKDLRGRQHLSEESKKLLDDIDKTLAHDNYHITQEEVMLPEGVERDA